MAPSVVTDLDSDAGHVSVLHDCTLFDGGRRLSLVQRLFICSSGTKSSNSTECKVCWRYESRTPEIPSRSSSNPRPPSSTSASASTSTSTPASSPSSSSPSSPASKGSEAGVAWLHESRYSRRDSARTFSSVATALARRASQESVETTIVLGFG